MLGVQLAVPGRECLGRLVEVGVRSPPQVGVGLRGLDEHHPDPPRRELHPQGVGQPLRCELRGGVGAHQRRRDAAAERRHEHDPAAGRPQPRQHRLGDGRLTDHVHLQLAPELVDRHRLDRSTDDHAGVVDERVEPLRQALVEGRDLRGVGDVERHRRDGPGGARRPARPRPAPSARRRSRPSPPPPIAARWLARSRETPPSRARLASPQHSRTCEAVLARTILLEQC